MLFRSSRSCHPIVSHETLILRQSPAVPTHLLLDNTRFRQPMARRGPCISCISCISLLSTVCSPTPMTLALPVRSLTQPLCTTSGHPQLPGLQRSALTGFVWMRTSHSSHAAKSSVQPPSGV
ncbi:hypothetical protein BDW60DRAFT_190536 [Aspergillus nidulans var. acristatus]